MCVGDLCYRHEVRVTLWMKPKTIDGSVSWLEPDIVSESAVLTLRVLNLF